MKKGMSSGKGHAESHNPQQRLEHLNAVLRAIRSVNQLIVHEENLDALLQQACGLLVQTRGYYSAWIALLDGEGNLRTAAESGLDEAFQSMAERLQHGEFPAGVRRALAEPGVHVIHAPVKECVDCPLSHSYEGRSGMTVRLEHRGEMCGLMSVSVPAEYAQDDEEAELLQEVAADIAYAVQNIAVEDERKKTEEALQQAEETLRASLELAPDAIYMTDMKGVFLYGNRKAEEIIGYKKEELIGKSFLKANILPARQLAKAAKLLALSVLGKPTGPDEIELLRKDGSGVWVEANTAHITQRGAEVVIGFARDITERKQVEVALQASEEKYRALAEAAPDAIVGIGEEGRVLFWNSGAERMFGYAAAEVMGNELTEFIVPPRYREARMTRLVEFLQTGTGPLVGKTVELVALRKDGTEFPIELSLAVTGTGTGLRAEAIVRDITERKRAQEQLERSFFNLAGTISGAMSARDPYTARHQERVADMVCLVGQEMGLDEDRLQQLRLGALLHDIGKIAIPEVILTKPGKLPQEEWDLVRTHASQGYEILKDTGLPGIVAEMALHHHERLDGSGYPDGLRGDELSPDLRILIVCNVAEAMSAFRPYRRAYGRAAVLEELGRGRGTKYDAEVVDIVRRLIEAGRFKLGESQQGG